MFSVFNTERFHFIPRVYTNVSLQSRTLCQLYKLYAEELTW